MVFNVFGSRDLPRDPQETQEPPKRHPRTSKTPCKKMPNKSPNKCLRGKNCLKPAISFWIDFGPHVWWLFLLIFKLIVSLILDHCLEPFRIPFWKPWWMKTGQREKQMTQNNHQRHQKPQKQHSQKNIKKTISIFDNKGHSRMSLEAQDVHNDSPTEIQTTKERNPKSKP